MRYKFCDVCEDVTKTATKIPQSLYLASGKTPIFDQGEDEVAGYSNNEGAVTKPPYIAFGDHTCRIKYITNPCFIGADGVKLMKVKNDSFDPRYVFYSLI